MMMPALLTRVDAPEARDCFPRHRLGGRRIGDVAAQRDIDAFLDEVCGAVQENEVGRHGREGFEIGIDDRPEDLLAADRRRRHGEGAARRDLLARRDHLGLPQVDENAAADGGVALADLTELDGPRDAVE